MNFHIGRLTRILHVLAIGFWGTAATAQEQPATAPPENSTPAAAAVDPAQAKAAFAKKFEEYKAVVRDIEQLRIKYQTASPDERKKINAEMTGHVAHAQTLINAVVEAALAAYRAAPDADPQITELLKAIARYDTIGRPLEGEGGEVDGGDQYEKAMPIIKALVDGGDADRNVYLWGFVSAFATADYDLAEKYLKQAQQAKPVEEPGADRDSSHKNLVQLVTIFAPTIDHYRTLWEKESAIRAAEAKADDLPRVKLTTSKGEIVVELFENEAPQTVANFLTLVKQGFYDGSPFHRVLPTFMAQGGGKAEDSEKGPGYCIRSECSLPNHRNHFRGALSMAHLPGLPDSGSSQFFLNFRPTNHLDGEHTVFGRVLEGIEVLGDLQHRDPTKPNQPAPDKIIKAEVIRDRGHEYKLDKLPEPSR